MSKRNLSDYQYFKIDVTDGIACIAFNRVKKHNVVTLETFKELNEFLMRVGEDEGIDVVILTGNGEKAFCAGVDIESFEIQNAGQALEWAIQCQSVFSSIERLPKPVIAAVNGFAFGFGVEIAMVCDITLASEKAIFGMLEIKHGLLPAVLLTRGREILDKKTISYLAMTGDHFSAQEAKEYGLINKVVTHISLIDEAYAVARRIQGNSPLGVSMVKRLLNRQGEKHSDDVVSFLPTLFLTNDFGEARRAFAERRSPNFKAN